MSLRRNLAWSCTLLAASLAAGGCAVFHLGAAMAQSAEYQKVDDVLAEYTGLQDHKVAVIVDADMATLVQFPTLVRSITHGVSARIAQYVPGAQVVDPDYVLRWQYQTLQWNALSYSAMAEAMGVERLVYIDVYEYRLHPPGNRWLWEGVCAAGVLVIEADGLAPDAPVESWEMSAEFPRVEGVTREEAGAAQIEYGVLHEFIKHTVWLFHDHKEPRYPDRYIPQAGDDRLG